MSGLDKGGARNSDPETSHIAADRVDTAKLMLTVYDAMAEFGDRGCILDDLEDVLPNVPVRSFSPRFVQMVEKGMIEVTGETRPGRSGRPQDVRRAMPRPWVRREPRQSELVRLRARVAQLERENEALRNEKGYLL